MKKIIVLEGPSGVGKDTIIKELVRLYPETYIKMPSTTSRPMRPGESQGNPYFFITRKEFEKKIKTGDVFEFTLPARDGDYRGMSKQIINDLLATGKTQIKDCDWIGIEALRKEYGDIVLAIYVNVPKEEVARRIRERGGDEKDIQRRIADYDDYKKIRKWCEFSVDNIELGKCVADVHSIINGESV